MKPHTENFSGTAHEQMEHPILTTSALYTLQREEATKPLRAAHTLPYSSAPFPDGQLLQTSCGQLLGIRVLIFYRRH